MKILLASHLFFPSHKAGTEVLTLELARSLRDKGHHVDIVSCTRHKAIDAKKTPWLSKENFDNFDVFHINFGVKNNNFSVMHHIDSPDRLAILEGLALKLSPDLVHFHHINGFSAAAIPAMKNLGLPVFFTATDFWALCTRTTLFRPDDNSVCSGPETSAKCLSCAQPRLPHWVARTAIMLSNDNTAKLSKAIAQLLPLKNRLDSMTTALNTADRVITATNFQANMLGRYGVKESLIKVIRYGVRLGELPRRTDLPDTFSTTNRLKIVFIGSLIPIKGGHILLEALRKLPNEKLGCVDVTIYGKTPTENKDYAVLLQEHVAHLQDSVRFPGLFSHDEIGTVLRNAHLCVIPSIWYENAPLVLCSAIAAGTPVLISNMRGMTEVIEDGVNGISFPAGDSDQLAHNLSELIDNPDWLKKVAHFQVDSYRTPNDYCNDVEAEYLSCLHNPKDHVEPPSLFNSP
jgi:glycosyltransferase involved in cell wall biosynthesis